MRFTSLFCAAFLTLAPVSVFAGFQFVAPSDTKTPATADRVAPGNEMPSIPNEIVKGEPLPLAPAPEALPAPAAPQDVGTKAIPLTPIISDSDALIISDEPAPRAAPMKMQHADAPLALPPMVVPPMEMPREAANDDTPIQGFGRSVPLVMALQQIVPPNYRYSFGNGVPAGMRVSWSGGKPWKDVVADLAAKNDMNVEIVSNVIAFRRRNPMDIISAQTTMPSDSNAVQGMPLKPLASAPAPLVPSPWQGADATPAEEILPPIKDEPIVADAAPMKLLETKAEMPSDVPEVDAFSMPENTVVKTETTTTKVEEKPVAEAKKKNLFDRIFDFDKPAKQMDAPVADEKKIEVAEEPSVTEVKVTKMDVAPASDVTWEETKTTVKETKVASIEPPMPVAQPPVQSDAMVASEAALNGSQEWQGQKGRTLRQTLTEWSQSAGVSMVWSSEYDYPLQTDVRIQGSYPDAVRTMLAGFGKAKPRPLARLFRNKSVGAQPVLVVETEQLTR